MIPKSNERDLTEIPDNVKEGLIIESVETIDQVLQAALVTTPIPLIPPKTAKTDEQALRH